jgi:hypothetical protein
MPHSVPNFHVLPNMYAPSSASCILPCDGSYSPSTGTHTIEAAWRMDWKVLLAHRIGSVDQEICLWSAYLVTEHWLLRMQITGRIRLHDDERQTLAEPWSSGAASRRDRTSSMTKTASIGRHCTGSLMLLGSRVCRSPRGHPSCMPSATPQKSSCNPWECGHPGRSRAGETPALPGKGSAQYVLRTCTRPSTMTNLAG